MLHPISTYDAITQQKSAGMWNSSLALSPGRMGTLDFYYKIYELVLKYEPQKTRGYRSRICYNEQIIKSLWGGVSKDRNNVGHLYPKGCLQRDGENYMDINLEDIIKAVVFIVAWIVGLFLYGISQKYRRKR